MMTPERILEKTEYGTVRFFVVLHPDDLADLSTHYYEARLNGRIEGFFVGLLIALAAFVLWRVFT